MIASVARLLVAVLLLAVAPTEPLVDLGLAAWLIPGVLLLLAFALGRALARSLLNTHGQPIERFEHRRRRFLFVCRYADLALHACAVFLFGWAGLVGSVAEPSLASLLQLLPFVAASTGAAAGSFRISTFFWQPKPSMGQYVSLRLRMLLLPVSLFFVLGLVQGAVESGGLRELFDAFPGLEALASLVLVLGVFFVLPRCARVIFPSHHLPEGLLKTELVMLASELGIQLRGIYLWDTQGARIATAFVTGTSAKNCSVFISDGLLTSLSTESLIAVFAHELGHVVRRHSLYYLLFFVSLLLVALPVHDYLTRPPPLSEPAILLLCLLALLVWFVSFSFLSRNFELEADLVGYRLIKDAELYSKTLATVGSNSGLASSRNSWRHFSVDRRRAFVERCSDDQEFHKRSRRRFSRIRKGIAVGLIVSSSVFGFELGSQTCLGDAEVWLAAGNRALSRDDAERAGGYFRRSLRDKESSGAWLGLGRACALEGKPKEALDALGKSRDLAQPGSEGWRAAVFLIRTFSTPDSGAVQGP